MAAFFLGPKTLNPFAKNTSVIPPTKGSSGPTMVKSIFSLRAKSASLSNSITPMGTH